MSQREQRLIIRDPAKGIKVDAGIVAKSFREEIKEKVALLKKSGIGESSELSFLRRRLHCLIWLGFTRTALHHSRHRQRP